MTVSSQSASAGPGVVIDADAFKAFEVAGWEQKAPTYENFVGRVTSRVVDRLLDAAGVGAGMEVLDVATGPGYAAVKATARGAVTVGVDIAAAMVARARELHPGIDFRLAPAEALPFQDGAFDAVVGNFVILHLGRPERAVREFVRVLKSGGQLSLTAWDVAERTRLLGVFLDALADVGASAPPDLPAGPPFFRFADDDQFTGLLKGGGLINVEIQTITFNHHVATADQLWDGLLAGAVRTSALIQLHSQQVQRRIRAAFDRKIREYRCGDGLALPVSVKLAHGRKPF